MKRFALLCVVAAVACGGDDEKIPVIDAAVIDAPLPIDGAVVDADIDADITIDAMVVDAAIDAPAATVNGCTQAGATDRTATGAARAIAFGDVTGNAYSPPACASRSARR